MMEQKLFTREMTKTRQLIYGSSILMLVLVLTGTLMLAPGEKSLLIYIEIIAGIAIVIFALSLAFLLSYYLSRPQVKEKHRLFRQLKQNQKEMESAKADLAVSMQKKKTIGDVYNQHRLHEKERFTHHSATIQRKIEELENAQEQELLAVLHKIQQDTLESGLRAVAVEPAHIPGIGDMLVDKLQLSGIQTAWDVTQDTVRTIPGFGESKTLSLLRWRESLENSLRSELPQAIPAETAEGIEQKYASQILALQTEMVDIQNSHHASIEQLRTKEAEELVTAELVEINARQALGKVQAQQQENQDQLAQYRAITFPKLFLAILTGEQSNFGKRLLTYLVFAAFFLLGIASILLLCIVLLQSLA